MAFTTCVYREGVREDHSLPFEQISDVLEQPDTLVWVDVNSPDESEVAQLGEEFGLHRLALADALSDHQRPKMERYEGYVFVIAYAAAIGEAGRVDMQEVAIFVSQRFVISIRHGDLFTLDAVRERIDLSPSLLEGGGAEIAYEVLDELIDGYFPVVEAYEDRIEKSEAELLGPGFDRDAGVAGGDLPDQARPAHVPPRRGAAA